MVKLLSLCNNANTKTLTEVSNSKKDITKTLFTQHISRSSNLFCLFLSAENELNSCLKDISSSLELCHFACDFKKLFNYTNCSDWLNYLSLITAKKLRSLDIIDKVIAWKYFYCFASDWNIQKCNLTKVCTFV